MKSVVLCVLIGGLVFSVGLGVQLGALREESGTSEVDATEPVVKAAPAKPAAPKRMRFPDDLTAATLSKPRPIPGTAAFTPGPNAHKLAMLRPGGLVHEWQEYIPEEWRALRCEETELVVVVGNQKKTFVDEIHFQAGPPIRRYIFDVVVSVVEPKTGNVVGYRTFRNLPRNIRNVEAWETTALGRPIGWNAVFRWVSSNARIGFPEEHDPNPIINQTDS
jgi:hypothetical protein